MKYKTLPILLAFFVMGVADAMGPMSKGVKDVYGLSETMSTLLTFFVFIAFAVAVFSVPGGLLAARYRQERSCFCWDSESTRLRYSSPASICRNTRYSSHVWTSPRRWNDFLQVSGNPIMRDVSEEGAYSRNLSFAQG